MAGKSNNCSTLGYVPLCHHWKGGYWPQVCIFKIGDYVYM
jgi:hypothetical protein